MGAWKALVEAGVPVGTARSVPRHLDRERIREAVRALAAGEERVEAGDVEPLLAWLRAWRRHWPESFAALGADGPRLIRQLEGRPLDRNRYLKLRRLALANLAAVL